MRRIAIALFLFFAAPAFAQNCSPLMGLGAVQFIDNLGNPLTNGALYVYQSGTSTQAPSFSDSQCTVQNTNPVTFATGGRATIWVNTSGLFKFVLCQVSTDGPACSGGDQLFTIDNVPGGVTGGGGGASAPFITNSANPATSGILRLSSGDSVCWRNVANSANLCFKKDTNDLLSWDGGSFKLPEVAAPTSVTGFDIIYADSTAHRYKQCSNGVACAQIANAGVDVNTSDQVTQLHFGATGEPLSTPAPTTNQFLQFNGTNIIGSNTLTSPTVNGGIVNSGTGVMHIRFASCTTTNVVNGACTTAFTWPGTWANTSYTAVCSVEANNILLMGGIFNKTTTQMSYVIYNAPGVGTSGSGTIDCIGIHD